MAWIRRNFWPKLWRIIAYEVANQVDLSICVGNLLIRCTSYDYMFLKLVNAKNNSENDELNAECFN